MASSSQRATDRLARFAQAARNGLRTRSAIANWPEFLGYIALGRAGVVGKEFTVRTRSGLRLRTMNHDVSWTPIYEIFVEDTYRLTSVAELKVKAPKILDLGGHIGAFSIAVAARYPDSRIWCFEPSSSTFQYLTTNLAANSLASRVEAFNVAIGPADGSATLYEDDVISGQSSLNASPREPKPSSKETEVRVESFEGAIERAGGLIDLVKMDIEGGEYPLLSECRPEVWRSIAGLLIEYHPVDGHTFDDVEAVLKPLGFETIWREDAPRAGCGTAYLRNPKAQPISNTEPAS
jgi:FkbM family methyltransferase